jgi:hypothetical protein
MVFGLALSIGSLFLILNVSPNGVPNLSTIFFNILFFGFGFVIIVMIWLGYSRTMSVLPIEVPSALFLNIVLLFTIAIEPYLLYVLFTFANHSDIAYYSSTAYALDIGTTFFVLAGLARLVIKENTEKGKLHLHPIIIARFKSILKIEYLVAGFFLVSALPIFWVDTPIGKLRFILWYSSFVFFFARRPPKAEARKNETSELSSAT